MRAASRSSWAASTRRWYPDEAARYADALFIGECETLWPAVDRRRRSRHGWQPRYDGGTSGSALLASRTDRIFEKYSYEYVSAQTTRGCPMDCSFCSVTAFNGRLFRMRDDRRRRGGSRRDPGARHHLRGRRPERLFAARRSSAASISFGRWRQAQLDKQWITQVTINFGDDDELPRLARAAGCAGVFIGLESTDTKSLALIRKDGMSQRRGLDYYRENVARIRRHGIGVVGSFILGIDTQNMDTIVVRHPAVRGRNRTWTA